MVNSESKDFCLCERLHACEGAYAMDVSKHWDRMFLSSRTHVS